jgi:hypothetical protein
VLGDLFYQLGTLVGGLGPHLPGKAGAGFSEAPGDAAVYDPETGIVTDGDDPLGEARHLAAAAGAAWLASRVLRPRGVSWPRVVIAGVAATFLADLVGRALDPARPQGGEAGALDADPEVLVRRYAAGIAMAAGYAALLYPRLPGPPLLRGLAFGALDVAASPRGGLAGLVAETPALRFPLQELVLPEDEPAPTGPMAPLAFGLALGLFYRYEADDEAHDDDDEDFA